MLAATIIGARPQFIKAAPMGRALLQAGIEEYQIHTGQHYDARMSDIFFKELQIPEPHLNLKVGSSSHGRQTGRMLIEIEAALERTKVDAVIVYGDTNSTLAGALAACKMGIPLFHIEAGLRSFNRAMPEEHNRVLTDHCSDLLFCPTGTALENLRREGLADKARVVGDLMYDAILGFAPLAEQRADELASSGFRPGEYLLLTLHRAENTNDKNRLASILAALEKTGKTIIFPLHPRTGNKLEEHGLSLPSNVRPLPPQGYLDMLALIMGAHCVLTDSGGVQKEAFWLKTPCVTLREETEWIETVATGWNRLAGACTEAIVESVRSIAVPGEQPDVFGSPGSAARIAEDITSYLRDD